MQGGTDRRRQQHHRLSATKIAGTRCVQNMGAAEIGALLTHLAVERRVSASTPNQAFAAILFGYQKLLDIELPAIAALRARRPERVRA
jgi:Phage integrase, N-terminal SAM-like domain